MSEELSSQGIVVDTDGHSLDLTLSPPPPPIFQDTAMNFKTVCARLRHLLKYFPIPFRYVQ